MGKWCLQASSFIFDRIFVKLAGNQDRHKISDKFEFRPDRISHFGVICPWGRIKFSTDILWNLQVQTLEFFVTLFSGTVRPRRLKFGTHVGSGQMYHVYRNQAAAAYVSVYFFLVFFLSNFQYWNFSSHFSRDLWGLEDWNLVHTWTVGRCIMYTGIRLLLLIRPFISSFFFLSNFRHWNFSSHFSRELWGLRLKIGPHVDSGQMYHVYQNQAAAAYSSLYFFIFLSLQFSTLKFFVTLFSGTHPAGDVTRVSVMPRKVTVKIGDAENRCRGCRDKNQWKRANIPVRLVLSEAPFKSGVWN